MFSSVSIWIVPKARLLQTSPDVSAAACWTHWGCVCKWKGLAEGPCSSKLTSCFDIALSTVPTHGPWSHQDVCPCVQLRWNYHVAVFYQSGLCGHGSQRRLCFPDPENLSHYSKSFRTPCV